MLSHKDLRLAGWAAGLLAARLDIMGYIMVNIMGVSWEKTWGISCAISWGVSWGLSLGNHGDYHVTSGEVGGSKMRPQVTVSNIINQKMLVKITLESLLLLNLFMQQLYFMMM